MAPITKDDILNLVQSKLKEKEEVIVEQMKQIQQYEEESRATQDKIAELQLRVEELEGMVRDGDELKNQLAQLLGNENG